MKGQKLLKERSNMEIWLCELVVTVFPCFRTKLGDFSLESLIS